MWGGLVALGAPSARSFGLALWSMAAGSGESGAAGVEHVGIVALVAVLLATGVAAVLAEGEIEAGRELGSTLGRRIACGPRAPGACRHHPLVPAYGWPLARLIRALAPAAAARTGPGGLPLVPVDFRRCRRQSCAVPRAGPEGARLTVSNRLVTAFTEVLDLRRSAGWIRITFWLYRPTLGWERVVRRAGAADVEAAAGVPVLRSATPALVPLETLPGRDHYEFAHPEEPPWRWRVRGRYPGWSS